MENITEAVRLLKIYTAGRFDVWMLAGSQRASCRAHIMSALEGRKVPQSQSGVNALRDRLNDALGVTGPHIAAREQALIEKCQQVAA